MENTRLLTALVTVTLAISLLNLYITFDMNSKFDSGTGKVLVGQDVQPTQQAVQKSQQPSRVQVSTGDDPANGLKSAPVTIIEFSDFQCPYCEIFSTQTLPLIEKNYVSTGKVRFVYRDFPIKSHKYAEKAAEAAKCANEQGKFWEYHNELFSNQNSLDISSLMLYAKNLNLDATTFNDCLNSGRMASKVQKDYNDGLNYSVQGTPTFFINGIELEGAQPYTVFEQVIDGELNTNSKS
jgi:protein-disulfide isomerase